MRAPPDGQNLPRFSVQTIGPEPSGATPIEPEDLEGLIPDFVATRADLNQVEFENITKAIPWGQQKARSLGAEGVLDYGFMLRLHRRLGEPSRGGRPANRGHISRRCEPRSQDILSQSLRVVSQPVSWPRTAKRQTPRARIALIVGAEYVEHHRVAAMDALDYAVGDHKPVRRADDQPTSAAGARATHAPFTTMGSHHRQNGRRGLESTSPKYRRPRLGRYSAQRARDIDDAQETSPVAVLHGASIPGVDCLPLERHSGKPRAAGMGRNKRHRGTGQWWIWSNKHAGWRATPAVVSAGV